MHAANERSSRPDRSKPESAVAAPFRPLTAIPVPNSGEEYESRAGGIAMGEPNSQTFLNRLFRGVSTEVEADPGGSSTTITRYLDVGSADGRLQACYAVDFRSLASGMLQASCRELPEVAFQCRDVLDGLARAQLAIEAALAPTRYSSDFPF